MNTLAVSCSTRAGSIAFFKDGTLEYSKLWLRSKSHGEIITPSIELGLAEMGWKSNDIELLAVDKGPGSFTGIRVAINSVKSLAYAHDIPVWAEDSLKIMTSNIPLSYKRLLCCLNAFKNELYIASFEAGKKSWKQKWKPQSIEIGKLNQKIDSTHYYVGAGIDPYLEDFKASTLSKIKFIDQFTSYPTAMDLGKLCVQNYSDSKTLDWNSLTSLYLKASAAEEKLKKGLLKPLPKL